MRWSLSHRADPHGAALADRHYNRRSVGSPQFVPPGRCVVLVHALALWVTSWPFAEYTRHAWPGAWVNSTFRNEGAGLSSELITEACAATRSTWGDPPPEGLITFIDPGKVRPKRDPGRCYRRAGFEVIGATPGGHGRAPLIVLALRAEKFPPPICAVGRAVVAVPIGGDGVNRVIVGDCRAVLPTLPAESVQCVVTSPPYWGLRDYGVDAQLGLEQSPDEYVANLVGVFRDLWRVLRPDGVAWLNLGDTYVTHRGQASRGAGGTAKSTLGGTSERGSGARVAAMKVKIQRRSHGRPKKNGGGEPQAYSCDPKSGVERIGERPNRAPATGLKHKDLALIPARASLALQADGWWVRGEVIWHKPSPMPESVSDRPTTAHEKIFLLTKADRYFYDAAAISEPTSRGYAGSSFTAGKTAVAMQGTSKARRVEREMRNARSVWTIAPRPYGGAHFAVMPPELAQRCILAGSRIGDTVLDPFMGSGTVGMVAESLGRRWVGVELNPAYEPLIRARTAQCGLLSTTGRVA